MGILGGANLLTFVVYKKDIFILSIALYTTKLLKILLFYKKILKEKSPSAKYQRAGNCQLPRQNDFRTFCMSDETEKVYQKLKEIISIC